MNQSPVTNVEDFDYRFVVYLLNEVFEKEVLAQSSVYKNNSKSRKYQELDKTKLEFVEGN